MGFNTTVHILNDCWDQIEKHPDEFVKGIAEKMHDGGTVGVGICANPVQVIRSGHADSFRVFATYHNSIIELSPYCAETLKLAERMPDLVKDQIRAARGHLNRLEEQIDG